MNAIFPDFRNTPLHHAARYNRNSDIIKLLVDCGAQMGAVKHLKTDKKRKYLSQLSQLILASLIFSDLVIRKLVSSEVCKVDDNVVAVLDLVFE